MKEAVKIAVRDGGSVPVESLNFLQGDLKEITPENRLKLRREILGTGFAFKPHVWMDPEDDKFYLVDGHQRVSVLNDLIKDGYDVPPIPIAIVDAPSIEDARRRILQASSQYGHMTPQGLFNFSVRNDINLEDLKASFDFPTIDMEKFGSFFSKTGAVKPKLAQGATEIDEDQFSHLIHTCPSCGHRFGKGE